MVGVIVVMVLARCDETMSLKPYPFEAKAGNGDPIFLTGSDCFKHRGALRNLRGLFAWNASTIIAAQDFFKSRRAILHASELRQIKQIDSDGNTILNRILMAHVQLEEADGVLAFQAIKKRRLVSLRPNRNGQSPLMLAVEAGWPTLVNEILKLHPNFDEKDTQSHDAIDYMAYCQLRPDNNIAASKVVYNVEGIAEQLLSLIPAAKRPMMQAKALKILTEIRKENFESGIRP